MICIVSRPLRSTDQCPIRRDVILRFTQDLEDIGDLLPTLDYSPTAQNDSSVAFMVTRYIDHA